MLWIALRPAAPPADSPPHDAPDAAPEQLALAWWALQFSPRVGVQEGGVLFEVQDSLRLFGGQRRLLQRVREEAGPQGADAIAVAPTALGALALLRTLPRSSSGDTPDPSPLPARACKPNTLQSTLDALPLAVLSATRPHATTLHSLGCHTLGALRALPRGGVSRRFGAPLLEALDRAYGLRPETLVWVSLPERFNARLEFLGRIEVAEGLLFGARRLLTQLGAWLQSRQRGVVALALHWEHDLVRRGDACNGQLDLRTAQATRDLPHLTRLLAEHLAQVRLPAPVVAIRLEATETELLAPPSASLLPEDLRTGEALQHTIERLSARLGPERVLCGQLLADPRPQHMQQWQAASSTPFFSSVAPGASSSPVRSPKRGSSQRTASKAPQLPPHIPLQPPWLLREPLRLIVREERPVYQGPLTLLAGPERLEAGWWSLLSSAEAEGEELSLRDYYVAQSPVAGLVWVYRRRSVGEPAWYLQGVYG